ncbi:MAG: AI-2E family transporter [Armatimonadota bacterium]
MGARLDPKRVRFAAFLLAIVTLLVLLFKAAPVIWPVVQLFIIAGFITLALDSVVRWQVARGMPRWAATVNTLVLLVLLVSFFFYFFIPPVVEQARQFVAGLPLLWAQITAKTIGLLHRFPYIEQSLNLNAFVSNLLTGAGDWAQAARSVFTSAIGIVGAIILIIVISLYALLNPWPLLYGIRGLFPKDWWSTIDRLASSMAYQLRAWVLGTLALAFIIGMLNYLALTLINKLYSPNLPFVFFFAILSGLLEVIPVVGPIVSAVLPTLVGFSLDPILGLLVLGSFFFIQQLENYLITPLVMQKAVRVHPVTLLFSLVLLSALFGVFGAVIATPVAAVLKVIYNEWYYPFLHDGASPPHAPSEDEIVRSRHHEEKQEEKAIPPPDQAAG